MRPNKILIIFVLILSISQLVEPQAAAAAATAYTVSVVFSPVLAGFTSLGLAALAAITRPGQLRAPKRSRYSRRYGRSTFSNEIGSFDDLIAQAAILDKNDCAKKFICELATRDDAYLDGLEKLMKFSYGSEYRPSAMKFNVAALIGKLNGPKQCEIYYGRCKSTFGKMEKILQNFETAI